jgi:hypothetical protein
VRRGIGTATFTTLQAVVREWAAYRRISEIQGLGWSGISEEEGERFTRLWLSPEGVREERDTGQARDLDKLHDADHWPLIETPWLTDAEDLAYVGQRRAAGRDGTVYEAREPASFVLPGSDRVVGVFDMERAVLLRVEAWLADEPLMVEEFTEVQFDRTLG